MRFVMYRAFAEPFIQEKYTDFCFPKRKFNRNNWVSRQTLDKIASGKVSGMDVLDAICINEGQGIVKMREYSKKVLVGGD
jgi:hypothetical protein